MEPLAITIRLSTPADTPRLRRLAALDSQPAPSATEPMLLAEIDGELWAAVGADSARRLADPFRRSGPIVELLSARAAQIQGVMTLSPRRRRGRIALRSSSLAV